VGAASTAAAGVALAAEVLPDVAVVDFQLPDGRGTDAAASIRAVSAAIHVLIITGAADESVLVAAIRAGCSGVITKDRAFVELADAIRLVAAGGAYVDAHVLATVRPHRGPRAPGLSALLTKREREVVRLLAQGHSNRAISAELYVSLHTVRNHVQNILEKLNAHSKLEAVAVARREGLLDDQQ
jgi:DNA-binding NarL/FixJ family response regulator